MPHDKQTERIESVLGYVNDNRRAALKRLLLGAGVLLAAPVLTSTAIAWPEDDDPEPGCRERKIKKGKRPGEFYVEVKKKKCPPDAFWVKGKGKKGKAPDDFWGKGKGKRWYPDEFL